MIDETPQELVRSLPEMKDANRLLRWGVIGSSLYIIAMVGYGWWASAPMLCMLQAEPDKFATFLSGVFAPLAFFWLVLGFKQQGDELKNSARALWLQGEELRNSVEQQRQLVEVSREQLASEYGRHLAAERGAEIAAQPKFSPSVGGSISPPESTWTFRFTCAGPTCSSAKLMSDGHVLATKAVLAEGNQISGQIHCATPADVRPRDIRIEYNDTRGNRRVQNFIAQPNEAVAGYPEYGDPQPLGEIEHL